MPGRDKREALIAAALPVLLGSGAAGLTLEPVLAAAGAGTGTFYHHFPAGKTDLVAAVYAEASSAYTDGVLRVLRRNRDAEAGVKAVVHHHVRWFAQEPARARLLLLHRGVEATGATRDLQRALRAWAQAVGLVLQPPDQLEALWLGPVLEWGRLSVAGAATGPDAAAERLAAAAWTALGGGGL